MFSRLPDGFDRERTSAVTDTLARATAPPAAVARPGPRPPLAAVIQRARANPRALTRDDVAQLHRSLGNAAVGRLLAGAAAANRTGLPDGVKAGVEALSGLSMDDVRVHRDSPEPARLGAHAYARGNEIHLGPGQERHLPHEAWHVVQQKQGRVAATLQVEGSPVNDDPALEREADALGACALRAPACAGAPPRPAPAYGGMPVQRKLNIEGPPATNYDDLSEGFLDELSADSPISTARPGSD